MTKPERKFLGLVYSSLQLIGGRFPSNPADIHAIVTGLHACNCAGKKLAEAISAMGYGELEEAVTIAQRALEDLKK